jgi:hypothetical protein
VEDRGLEAQSAPPRHSALYPPEKSPPSLHHSVVGLVEAGLGVRPLPPSYRCARRIYTCREEKGREEIDRWMALSTDATWLRLPLLMLLAPAASLSLSSRVLVGTRKGRGSSAWGNVTLPLYFFPVLIPALSGFSLSSSALRLCLVWLVGVGIETGLRNRKVGSGHGPAHLNPAPVLAAQLNSSMIVSSLRCMYRRCRVSLRFSFRLSDADWHNGPFHWRVAVLW